MELCFLGSFALLASPSTSLWKPQAIMPKCVNVQGNNGEEAIMNTEDANLRKLHPRAVSLAETAESTSKLALRMSEWAEERSSADTHLQQRMREVSPLAIDKGSYQLAVQLEELKSRDQLTVQREEESYLKLESTQNTRTLILQLEELKLRNLALTESVNNLKREKEVLAEVFRIGQVCPLYLLHQYKVQY